MNTNIFSRRKFLAISGAASAVALSTGSLANLYGATGKIPVGLELFSVRERLKGEQEATLRAVAKMGYQCVEFYAPYFDWTEAQAKQTRKLLDDLGMKCYSTHNSATYFSKDKLPRAKDFNLILGSKYLVMASSDTKTNLQQWRELADVINHAADELEPSGLKAGYHNHDAEFTALQGKRPMEILAENTKASVMLQLDVGTCLEAGSDPVAWIRANPGRIRSIHCKDWAPGEDKGYKVLFGEGIADWKSIFQAAEHGGGVEYYLVEQEGSRFSELDTAQKCLDAFKNAQASS